MGLGSRWRSIDQLDNSFGELGLFDRASSWRRSLLGEDLGELVLCDLVQSLWGCHWSDWVSEEIFTTSKRD